MNPRNKKAALQQAALLNIHKDYNQNPAQKQHLSTAQCSAGMGSHSDCEAYL